MDSFDYVASSYAFSIIPIVLSFPAMIASVIDAIRTRKFYGRYFLIFLTATLVFVRMATYLPVMNTIANTNSPELLSLIRGNMVRTCFYSLFVPLLYCVFLEVCRTIIVDVPLTNGEAPAKSRYRLQLFSTYVGYIWTIVLICTNIAYSVMVSNIYQSSGFASINLYFLNSYSVWIYLLLALAQFSAGFKELRHCITSLLGFLFMVLISNIGHTVSTVIHNHSVNSIVVFVLVDLIGIIGLLFALWASPRYWISAPHKPLTTNQPQYGYYAPGPAMAAPADQIQPQYPVVPIPQQQLQSGQHLIIQVPISHQQQNGQYPIVNVYPTV